MNGIWAQPGWLWLLAGVPLYFFAFLLAALLQQKNVPDLRLWKGSSDQSISRFITWSPDRWVPALLFALTICAISGALGHYIIPDASTRTEKIRVYLDGSASMRAGGPKRNSRWNQALNRLSSLVSTYQNRFDRVHIKAVVLGHTVRTFDGPWNSVQEQLRNHPPEEIAIDSTDFLRQLRNRHKTKNPRHDYVLTDDARVASFVQNLETAPTILGVGTSIENTGILDLQGEQGEEGPLHLFLDLKHFGTNKQKGTLLVRDADSDTILRKRTLTVSPGEITPVQIGLQQRELPKCVTVSWNPDSDRDAFRPDDTAYFSVSDFYDQTVLVSGPPNQNCSALLKNLEGVKRTPNKPADVHLNLSDPGSAGEPDKKPESASFVIGIKPERPGKGISYGKRTSYRSVLLSDHPILNNVDLQEMKLNQIRPFVADAEQLPDFITPLIRVQNGFVAYYDSRGDGKINFSFNPFWKGSSSDTNWPVVPELAGSFVVFWQNLFHFVRPWNLHRHGDLVYWRTGQYFLKQRRRTNNRINKKVSRLITETGCEQISIRNRKDVPYPRNLLSAQESNLYSVPDANSDAIPPLPKHDGSGPYDEEKGTRGYFIWATLLLFLSGIASLIYL